MNANEIVNNEEIMENTENLMQMTKTGNGGIFAAGVGVGAVVGVVAYNYVIKPIATKIKAKKEKAQQIEVVETDSENVDED